MKRCMVVCVSMVFLVWVSSAQAFIIINEFLADPASGPAGDANGDGVSSSTQDEFIELFNTSGGVVDVSGWYLTDAVSTRHVFGFGTLIDPYGFLVIFGGGSPSLPGISWQVASTGALGLNNNGDQITLYDADGNIMQYVSYGSEGGRDQSLVRYPEGAESEFVLHSTTPGSGGRLFSPGTFVDGSVGQNVLIPEPSTLLCCLLGWPVFALYRKTKESKERDCPCG